MTMTARMLTGVLPNEDVALKIHEMANQSFIHDRVISETEHLYEYILLGGADRSDPVGMYNAYANPAAVAELVQRLHDLGGGVVGPHTVYDVFLWMMHYQRVHIYDDGPHVPHVEAAMERIAGLIGQDPYESTSDDDDDDEQQQ